METFRQRRKRVVCLFACLLSVHENASGHAVSILRCELARGQAPEEREFARRIQFVALIFRFTSGPCSQARAV